MNEADLKKESQAVMKYHKESGRLNDTWEGIAKGVLEVKAIVQGAGKNSARGFYSTRD